MISPFCCAEEPDRVLVCCLLAQYQDVLQRRSLAFLLSRRERNSPGSLLTNRVVGVTSCVAQGKSSSNSAMLAADGSEIAMHTTLSMMSIWLLINALIVVLMMPVDKSAR